MCLKINKCFSTAIVSVLIGIAIGILFFNGILTGIEAGIIIALIFAGLSLLMLTIIGTSDRRKIKECTYDIGICAVIGAILTIIVGIIANTITVIIGSVGFAILIGVGGAAFFFTLFVIAQLIGCLLECNEDCKYE